MNRLITDKNPIVFKYKDSERVLWTIRFWELEDYYTDEIGEIHKRWRYDLYFDGKFIYYNDFIGHKNEIPPLASVLKHLSKFFTNGIIGMASYAKKIED